MELKALISLLRRWLWLIILCAVIAASISFVIVRTRPLRYQASATVQIGTYTSVANPSYGMIESSAELAQTYIALARTYPVLDALGKQLKLGMNPDSISGLFATRLIPGTSLLVITVTYIDPVIAADIANELANQLIINSPTNLTEVQRQQLVILQDEITQAQTQLASARSELKTVQTALSSATAQDLAILSSRQTELVNQINVTQANLAQMSATASSLQQEGQINSLKVVEPARIPEGAVANPIMTTTLLAAASAGALALAVGFVIEYLNDSIRVPSEVLPLLGVPLIGTIGPFGNRRNYKNKLITWLKPRSSMAEAYRALRVNLMYGENSDESPAKCRVYAVTSPGASEGKSVTVANIAITFAIAGMRVLLIDTDLRRPSMHLLFNVDNTTGLSSLWSNSQPNQNGQARKRVSVAAEVAAAGSTSPLATQIVSDHSQSNGAFDLPVHLIKKTAIPDLDLITAGQLPYNPAELLGTEQMQTFVDRVVNSGLYDAVFFDTPPVLVVSDASIVCGVSKARVILVASSGITRRSSAVRAVQQIVSLGFPLLGLVLNRLSPRDVDGGYGQTYYGYNKYADNSPRPKSAGTL